MTLVLSAAFCGDRQIATSYGFNHHCGSSMPCVFDGDALDFESALMTDWTSDITDYDTTDESVKAPSGPNVEKDLKRKNASDVITPEPKKIRKQESSPVPSPEIIPLSPQPHRFVHSPHGHHHHFHHHHHHHLPPSPLTISHSYVELPTDTATENEDNNEEEEEEEEEAVEEEFLPRRRMVPQMWNSRQRWKDERKKVLKMSIGKLAEIEDPELWLLRSVLINNTIKKLHLDIRNERQAKLRHRQQRMDYFAERFQAVTAPPPEMDTVTSLRDPDHSSDSRHFGEESGSSEDLESSRKTSSSELYDDASCDEIFGISEDFLRVTIPDRRVSSPLPSTDPGSPMDLDLNLKQQEPMDCTEKQASSTDCPFSLSTSPYDPPSGFYRPRTPTPAPTLNGSTTLNDSNSESSLTNSSSVRRHVGQCATQFRTSRGDCGGGDSTFPPRVPILDSVVYHSLLASLESS